jgi:hypothetical protein
MKASLRGRVRLFAGVGVGALAALGGSGSAEAAGHANGLGEKSELILSADRLIPVFSYSYGSSTETQNGVDATQSINNAGISILWGNNFGQTSPTNVHTLPRIAADFTIIPHLTLGAALAFGFGLGGTIETETVGPNGVRVTTENDSPRATAIGLVPRVGYIIPFTDVLAFWPRLGFGFYSVSSTIETTGQNNVRVTTSTTDTLFSLDLDPQLAIVPLEHFFFHVGPLINIPLSGSRSRERTEGATSSTLSNDISLFHLGLTAGLGGWFNL